MDLDGPPKPATNLNSRLPFFVAKDLRLELGLIELMIRRNSKTFEFLYNRYGGALYGVICSSVPDRKIADKIFVAAFEEIYRDISLYDRSKGSLFIWMYRITLRKIKRFP